MKQDAKKGRPQRKIKITPRESVPLPGASTISNAKEQQSRTSTREPSFSLVGRHNSRLKNLRMAFRRGELTAGGECAIDGIRLIEEALRSGQRITGVFFSESARSLADKLLPQISSRVEPLFLADSLFQSTVPSDSPQGVAALVKMRTWAFDQLLERCTAGILVVAAGIQDPGNLGTILRSAEAFEAAGVVILDGTVSPFNPKVLRGSAGSLFRVPFLRMPTTEAMSLLREKGLRLLGTSSHQGKSLQAISWTVPTAVFVGNEGAGLPRDLMHQMTDNIVIPHAPAVESLNVAVATSIVLYEASRQAKGIVPPS